MYEDERRAFLMRWVLEFGAGPVSYDMRWANAWYHHCGMSCFAISVRSFMITEAQYKAGRDEVQINEAGLAFIKGEPDDLDR